MSGELLGIDFASLMKSVFTGQLEVATIERTSQTIDAHGQTVNAWSASGCEGVLTQWDDRVRAARGYDERAVKIMLLSHGVTRPTTQDKITIHGAAWRIVDVRSGAGAATYEIAALLAS